MLKLKLLAPLGGVGPGLLASALIGGAAGLVATWTSGPIMLFALLFGIALNFLGKIERFDRGISFTSKFVLRLGVALLGLKITLGDVVSLGWGPLLLVVAAITLTILSATAVARCMGFDARFGVLSGGATAICGASAAMALSAALPNHPMKERATLFTVVGVSALSTLAMIVYPMIAQATGLDPRAAGVFLGTTIHDVAQVVGAGYSLSQQTGDVATVVKLMRVAMLVPVVVFAVVLSRRQAGETQGPRPPLLPGFAVGFALLVVVNSTGWLPGVVAKTGSDLSRWLLVASIAGIGMKTQLKELITVGFKPVALMIGETVFLAALTLALMHWLV